ncbi:MAG: hypothetical protein JWR37_556 [Mycobacterium sp.]|nr:hypothetical protein [Mycobacterium sp.]
MLESSPARSDSAGQCLDHEPRNPERLTDLCNGTAFHLDCQTVEIIVQQDPSRFGIDILVASQHRAVGNGRRPSIQHGIIHTPMMDEMDTDQVS